MPFKKAAAAGQFVTHHNSEFPNTCKSRYWTMKKGSTTYAAHEYRIVSAAIMHVLSAAYEYRFVSVGTTHVCSIQITIFVSAAFTSACPV
jgi:hypothetical protein